MDCNQTLNILNAYVDKELSKSDTTFLESHLEECAACREELENIRRLDASIRAEEITAPAELRSAIADKLEQRRTVSSRRSLKELLGMRFRIGLAAIVAAGLIVVGTMSTGGSAMAAYTKMKSAVTKVTSMHLHIEFGEGLANEIGKGMSSSHDEDKDEDRDEDKDNDKDSEGDAMASAFLNGITSGSGPKSVDVWSEDDKFRVSAFGGIDVACKDKMLTVMFGGKVFAKVPADSADMHLPKNLGEELFNEFSKMQTEMKGHFDVVDRGTVNDNGRRLQTLEVTGKDEEGKHFRMMYWVDLNTNLPAKFEVFAGDTAKTSAEPMVTITCDYNENYPDSLFEAAGVEKP